MDPGLRRAWTEIVTPEDYDAHMASIGQAQAAARLTAQLVDLARLSPGDAVTIAGAGTGQMFDFLDPAVLRPYRLTCADLNPMFLARLRDRLAKFGLEAEIREDDFEQTRLAPEPALLLATLLLEHIDWRRGVQSIAGLRPTKCGIILQENPEGMTTAVTPGRVLLPSIAKGMSEGHPVLIPKDRLIAAMAECGYACLQTLSHEVADGKRLVGLLFGRSM